MLPPHPRTAKCSAHCHQANSHAPHPAPPSTVVTIIRQPLLLSSSAPSPHSFPTLALFPLVAPRLHRPLSLPRSATAGDAPQHIPSLPLLCTCQVRAAERSGAVQGPPGPTANSHARAWSPERNRPCVFAACLGPHRSDDRGPNSPNTRVGPCRIQPCSPGESRCTASAAQPSRLFASTQSPDKPLHADRGDQHPQLPLQAPRSASLTPAGRSPCLTGQFGSVTFASHNLTLRLTRSTISSTEYAVRAYASTIRRTSCWGSSESELRGWPASHRLLEPDLDHASVGKQSACVG